MASSSALHNHSEFRNGTPPRMRQRLYVRSGGLLSSFEQRFAFLGGEVLSLFHEENVGVGEHIELSGAAIDSHSAEWLSGLKPRCVRIATTRKVYILRFGTYEEADIWRRSLRFASQHRFEDCYRLGKMIAKGTFSEIFLCTAHDSAEEYVVKRTRKEQSDNEALEGIERKRHINSMLKDSPLVVRAVDMFSTLERDYIVFEHMAGATLEDLLQRKKKLPESYARAVMKQVFMSLHYIHSNNVVHRDVQPSNIFCSATGFPMSIAIGDFDSAHFIPENCVNQEVLTTMVCISPYMSIDVARLCKYGPAADMWSAGVVLYEILSGKLPFTGRSSVEIVERIKRGRASFSDNVWETVSSDAIGLIKQLLQIDSHKRISALAALHHRWIKRPTMYSANSESCGMSRQMPSISKFSRIISTPSSRQSSKMTDAFRLRSNINMKQPNLADQQHHYHSLPAQSKNPHWGERQTLSLGTPTPQVSSMTSLSPAIGLYGGARSIKQQRMPMTPAVRAIQQVGLHRVMSHLPVRMDRLISSRVMQKQLSMALPYGRRIVVALCAFIFVSRLKALHEGNSLTKQLSRLKDRSEQVRDINDRRKKETFSQDVEVGTSTS